MKRDVARLLAILGVALLIGCGPGSGAKVTAANFDKLEIGMTLAQVEEVLGPGGLDATDPVLLAAQKKSNLPETTKWKKWQLTGPQIRMIAVGFVDGKVVSTAKMGL